MTLVQELQNPDLIDREDLKDQLGEYVSDQDLIDYFGKTFRKKIIKYSDLDNYSSIDNLLPKKKDFCVILVENEINSGHWVALLKYGNTVEYFNSYGAGPQKVTKFVGKRMNSVLEQSDDLLTNLLDNAYNGGKKIIYNKTRFQKLDKEIGTCGKHCILRCTMLKDFNMNLKGYIDWMEKMKKDYDLDADGIVSLLVEI